MCSHSLSLFLPPSPTPAFSFFLKGLREHLSLAHFLPQLWQPSAPCGQQVSERQTWKPPGRRRLLGSAPRSPQVQGPSEQLSQSPSNRVTSGVGRMTHTKQGLDLTVSSFQPTQLPCKHWILPVPQSRTEFPNYFHDLSLSNRIFTMESTLLS